MDENMNEALGGEVVDSEFEDWSDIDTSNLVDEADESEPTEEADETTDEADQPDAETEPEQTEGEKAQEQDGDEKAGERKEADQSFELKHLGETRTVNREEVVELAQKGMDYDRVRGKLDELRGLEAEAAANQQYADFVKELAAGAGISVEEMIDSTRAKILVDQATKQGQTLDMDAALQQAKQTREAKAQTEQQSKEMREARNRQEHFQEEAARFRTLYPEVKAEEIPPEVWAEFDKTGNLSDAWSKNVNQKLAAENQRLQSELDAVKQEKKNEARSTGSRKSAGASQRSAVDDAWEAALKNEW